MYTPYIPVCKRPGAYVCVFSNNIFDELFLTKIRAIIGVVPIAMTMITNLD